MSVGSLCVCVCVFACDSIMWSVCSHVYGSVVCVSLERKGVKSEQTECWGIYVIHAETVQRRKADSHPFLDSAALEGLYRPDLNVKCRR